MFLRSVRLWWYSPSGRFFRSRLFSFGLVLGRFSDASFRSLLPFLGTFHFWRSRSSVSVARWRRRNCFFWWGRLSLRFAPGASPAAVFWTFWFLRWLRGVPSPFGRGRFTRILLRFRWFISRWILRRASIDPGNVFSFGGMLLNFRTTPSVLPSRRFRSNWFSSLWRCGFFALLRPCILPWSGPSPFLFLSRSGSPSSTFLLPSAVPFTIMSAPAILMVSSRRTTPATISSWRLRLISSSTPGVAEHTWRSRSPSGWFPAIADRIVPFLLLFGVAVSWVLLSIIRFVFFCVGFTALCFRWAVKKMDFAVFNGPILNYLRTYLALELSLGDCFLFFAFFFF